MVSLLVHIDIYEADIGKSSRDTKWRHALNFWFLKYKV